MHSAPPTRRHDAENVLVAMIAIAAIIHVEALLEKAALMVDDFLHMRDGIAASRLRRRLSSND